MTKIDAEKQYREALANAWETHYVKTVEQLIEQCTDGLAEIRTGLLKKKITKYCGSRAFLSDD